MSRNLERCFVSMELLTRVVRADHLGRTTEDALAGIFPAGDAFLERALELEVSQQADPDVVYGRHLIARGLEPSSEFAAILERCREIQDDEGERNPERILDQVLD